MSIHSEKVSERIEGIYSEGELMRAQLHLVRAILKIQTERRPASVERDCWKAQALLERVIRAMGRP